MRRTFRFELQIETLAQNAIMPAGKAPAEFEASGIRFAQWDFNHRDGWLGDAWLAVAEIPAPSLDEAYKIFNLGLTKAVPRIAFVSQCYVEYLSQSYLITRRDQSLGFLRYTTARSP